MWYALCLCSFVPVDRWTIRMLCFVLYEREWLWYVCVSVELWYVGWVWDQCSSVLLQAGMSLCGWRPAMSGDASVDASMRVQEVLLHSMCCTSARSGAALVSMLVLCCWSFSPCVCVCMFGAFGLHGWVFV